MRRIRGLIASIVIWITAVVAVAVLFYIINKPGTDYTTSNSYVDLDENLYVSDNYRDNGLIWRMDYKGKVLKLYSTGTDTFLKGWNIAQTDLAGENICAVFYKRVNDNGRMITRYVVAEFNTDLQMNFISPAFRIPMESRFSGFDGSEENFFITALSDNGQQAYAYQLNASALMSITEPSAEDREKWEEAECSLKDIAYSETVWPRYYTDAQYGDEVFAVRYDNSEPGSFGVDETVSNLFKQKKMTPGQYVRAVGVSPAVFVIVALLGSMVIAAAFILLQNRRRAVYLIFWYEMLMAVGCVVALVLVVAGIKKAMISEYTGFASSDAVGIFDGYGLMDLSSKDIYDSGEYEIIFDRLGRREDSSEYGMKIEDLLVVDNLTGRVVMSISGNNLDNLGHVYGDEAESMLADISGGNAYAYGNIFLKGQRKFVLETGLSSSGYSGYSAVMIADDNMSVPGIMRQYKGLFITVLSVFVLASLAGVIFILLQNRDLRLLGAALKTVATTGEDIEKPEVVGKDMNYLWNSLVEIKKSIVSNNRIKYLTYEAYFRFAPKSIERILKKQSITEVKCTDAISLRGAIALLTVPTRTENKMTHSEIEKKSNLLTIAEKCREEYDGILVSENDALTELKYLFTDDNRNSSGFGTDLMLKLQEEKALGLAGSSMILHYAPYIYGVAGNEKQACVYIASAEADILAEYAEWFRQMRLALVLTEQLIEHENCAGDFRYIGFIIPDENNPERRIKLYEALDAEASPVRSRKFRQKKHFADALGLFYARDFYMARGMFSEILRESPDDELSKWYLFECERYLDGAVSDDFRGELHLDVRGEN